MDTISTLSFGRRSNSLWSLRRCFKTDIIRWILHVNILFAVSHLDGVGHMGAGRGRQSTAFCSTLLLWCVMAHFKPQLSPVIKSEHLFTLGLGPHTCGIWGKPSTTRHIGLNVCGRLFLRCLTHFCGFYHHLLLISFVEIFKKTGFNSWIHTFTFIHTFATQRHIIPDTDFWENLIFYIHTFMPRSVHVLMLRLILCWL